jgi:hypothetical protein
LKWSINWNCDEKRPVVDGALSGLGRFRKQEGYDPVRFKLEGEINVVDLLFEVANDNGS